MEPTSMDPEELEKYRKSKSEQGGKRLSQEELLRRAKAKLTDDEYEAIREEEYNQGYNDALDTVY